MDEVYTSIITMVVTLWRHLKVQALENRLWSNGDANDAVQPQVHISEAFLKLQADQFKLLFPRRSAQFSQNPFKSVPENHDGWLHFFKSRALVDEWSWEVLRGGVIWLWMAIKPKRWWSTSEGRGRLDDCVSWEEDADVVPGPPHQRQKMDRETNAEALFS